MYGSFQACVVRLSCLYVTYLLVSSFYFGQGFQPPAKRVKRNEKLQPRKHATNGGSVCEQAAMLAIYTQASIDRCAWVAYRNIFLGIWHSITTGHRNYIQPDRAICCANLLDACNHMQTLISSCVTWTFVTLRYVDIVITSPLTSKRQQSKEHSTCTSTHVCSQIKLG